ncbi:MAG: hypothetical protein WCJ09_26305 [Planctomycetota bacterium]
MQQLTLALALIGSVFMSRNVVAQDFGYVPPGFGGSFYGLDVGNGIGIGYGAGYPIPYQALTGSVKGQYVGEQCCWESIVLPQAPSNVVASRPFKPLSPKPLKAKKPPQTKQVNAKKAVAAPKS